MITLIKYLLIIIGFALIYSFIAKGRDDAKDLEFQLINHQERNSLSKAYIINAPETVAEQKN